MSGFHSRREFLGQSAGVLGILALGGRPSLAQQEKAASATELARKAVAFLRPRQEPNGGWSTATEPGISALVVTALLRTGLVTPAEPVVTKALAYLEGFVGPQGGLNGPHANYSTSIALLAFHEANTGRRYDGVIKAGQSFLKGAQWDETEDKKPDDPFYGGAGYGGKNSRPDVSNTSYFLESLRETGLPADDPNVQKAVLFLSRCQNLKSEFNDQPWAGKVNDGGFVYTTAGGGVSMAGGDPASGLRSYASMTYAGLKSMIYAGLTDNDPRVKAAYDYIRQHYSLDENPGLGQAGLYYYYHTFAKALALLGKPTLVDSSGRSHDWRAELVEALAKRQNANGSWVNPADRFMEGDPNLVTAYGLLALAYTKPKR
ncbi:MAG TPA: prenyltransferase/squalene oxidase repeat-containing protein [Isosphaeraceae bacterium]|nr:prenyltransferase/squalene oxidase repeat-containing protein [Isosphaeraceae bacterium]